MRPLKSVALTISTLLVLSGCSSTPLGPRVQVLPAANKPFEVFRMEQAECKQYAADQINGQSDNANERALGAALIGGALGAGLGAAVGGGRGAAIGAAGGGVLGTAVGASNSQHSQGGIQQQYDNAYTQCMYAKGNQVAQPVHTVVQPVVVYPQQPTVVYSPPPTVYYAVPPTVTYAPPPGATYAPPPGATYAPPPPPGTPAPQQ
ncbi:glycine zipper family protein [Magnetospirillum molischianum]|uniref:Glycine-zipper-containing OmpA-like membrane domain-containing protein n=1 Tax=Magnetospirillum molischianum DSM 120 TaxID=1150626 RepID=H8FRK9_MAGML|nr:glycine zipper family protein [Magnetospirillum molischianum]CCG40997.1 conserved exported hypothetical protein [Magnetospirillum molischianum DSM 120]